MFLIVALSGNLVTGYVPLNDGGITSRDYGGEVQGILLQHTVSAYTPHDPITITSDADFASQGWPGSGTQNDPYVIEGLNITTSGNCISISNTRVHFVIHYCLLTGGILGNGVSLDNVAGERTGGCTISEKRNGVNLGSSSNNSLVNNTISENSNYGVYLSFSYKNRIYLNILAYNDNNAYGGDLDNHWNITGGD